MNSVPVHEVRDESVSLATSKDDNKSHEEVLSFEKLEDGRLVICKKTTVGYFRKI